MQDPHLEEEVSLPNGSLLFNVKHILHMLNRHGGLFFKCQHVAGAMHLFAKDIEHKNTHLGTERIYLR